MAVKKESVAKCAGTLQCSVGRPDGANTMIKTIQYLAEADSSRVLVALDLKAAFENVARRAMPHSIEQSDPDLAAVFSRCYTGTSEQRLHNAVLTKDVLSRPVASLRPLTLTFDTCWLTAAANLTPGAKLFAYLDDWYLWIKPQHLLETLAFLATATRSVNLELQPS